MLPLGGPVGTRAIRKLVTTSTLSSRTCKWPIGDPTDPDFHYCGNPPEAGGVYCGAHYDMAHQAKPKRTIGLR
jgi:GcrA cell cycle regulator